jgi:hypothetical protein
MNVLACDYRCLREYFKYVRELKYDSKVDYSYLQSLLFVEARSEDCFEWCPLECPMQGSSTE